MWNPQKAGYLLGNILGSKVVKTNLKEDFHINYSVTKTGSLNVRSGRGRNPVFSEAIEKVALQVEEDKASNVQTSTSVRRVAEALDRPRSTAQKIMRNTLRYYPRKLQLVQELLPHDFETRHLFSLQFLARLGVDPEWPWNILWTDEAPFHLDGSELCAGGPVTCSITGQRYASVLRNKIIPDLQAHQCFSRIIFMQDGAPPHITRCVKDVLKDHFTEERVISRQIRHLWPPRLPDLNPCDFLLWGHLKQLFLGFGWKRVAINSGPKDLLKKRRVSRHNLSIAINVMPIPGVEVRRGRGCQFTWSLAYGLK
ncbi:transposable element tc3 transposase [Trichonephila clavipes]|nr:transposable element tc3 transposase [Trichonephila clavipes]